MFHLAEYENSIYEGGDCSGYTEVYSCHHQSNRQNKNNEFLRKNIFICRFVCLLKMKHNE